MHRYATLPQLPHELLTLEQLGAWGRALGAALPEGATLALYGELGAGKTTLVRSICEGLGVFDLESVTSPTFALVHEYESARGLVLHADLYRLKSPSELEQLGWHELQQRAVVTVVEWPERGGDMLPNDRLAIQLAHHAGRHDVRQVRLGTHSAS